MSKLAVDGGTPVRTAPWPGRIQIDDREMDAVMALMNAARSGGAFDRYGGTEVERLRGRVRAVMAASSHRLFGRHRLHHAALGCAAAASRGAR